jgi:hypothetical protein
LAFPFVAAVALIFIEARYLYGVAYRSARDKALHIAANVVAQEDQCEGAYPLKENPAARGVQRGGGSKMREDYIKNFSIGCFLFDAPFVSSLTTRCAASQSAGYSPQNSWSSSSIELIS